MTILEKIKHLCAEKEITIYRLEKDCGFSSRSIEKWGKSVPRSEALATIADYFNVSVDYLLGRAEEKKDYQIYFESLSPDNQVVALGLLKGLAERTQIRQKGAQD